MKSRSWPSYGWWNVKVDSLLRGCARVLMSCRVGSPILRGGPPLGTISMDLASSMFKVIPMLILHYMQSPKIRLMWEPSLHECSGCVTMRGKILTGNTSKGPSAVVYGHSLWFISISKCVLFRQNNQSWLDRQPRLFPMSRLPTGFETKKLIYL